MNKTIFISFLTYLLAFNSASETNTPTIAIKIKPKAPSDITTAPKSEPLNISIAKCIAGTNGYDLAKFDEPIMKYMEWDGEKGWMVTFIGKKEFPEDQFSVWFGEEDRWMFMIHGNYKCLPAEDNT